MLAVPFDLNAVASPVKFEEKLDSALPPYTTGWGSPAWLEQLILAEATATAEDGLI